MVSHTLHGAFIENWDSVKAKIEDATKDAEVKVRFHARKDNDTLEIVYLDWIQPPESKLLDSND